MSMPVYVIRLESKPKQSHLRKNKNTHREVQIRVIFLNTANASP